MIAGLAPRAAEAVEAGRAGLAEHPATGRLGRGARPRERRPRRRPPRARCRRRPRPATARRRGVERGAQRREPPRARTETRPRCGPSGHDGGPATGAASTARCSARDVAGARPRRSTCVVRAVPRDARRAGTVRRRTSNGGSAATAPTPRRRRAAGTAGSPARARPMVPSDPDQQPRAGRSRSRSSPSGPPPFTTRPSAVTKRTSSTAVAQRAPAQPPVAGQPGREHPADGGRRVAGVERALLAVRAPSAAASSATAVPAADGDGEVARVVGDDAGGRVHLDARRRPARRRPPSACALPTACDRVGVADRGAQSSSTSAVAVTPTRPRAPAGARRTGCPAGRILVGLARPDGSNASRSRAWASRSSALNTSGIASRFSSPMPCSPESTPPAATHAARISSPARCTRSQMPGSRASNTISGCRLPSPAWNTFIIVRRCSAAIA